MHADDQSLWPQLLYKSRHPSNQTPSAHSNKNDIDGIGMLAKNLQTDGALACDDIGVVKGVNEVKALVFLQGLRMQVGVRIGVSVKHNLGTSLANRINFDGWCGDRHNNKRLAAKLPCSKRNTLGMVTGRGGNDPLGKLVLA